MLWYGSPVPTLLPGASSLIESSTGTTVITRLLISSFGPCPPWLLDRHSPAVIIGLQFQRGMPQAQSDSTLAQLLQGFSRMSAIVRACLDYAALAQHSSNQSLQDYFYLPHSKVVSG